MRTVILFRTIMRKTSGDLTLNYVEYLGIVASLFIFLSFIFKNPTKIRAVNSIGSVLFIIYGIRLHSYSIVVLNIATVVLQIYQIVRNKEIP